MLRAVVIVLGVVLLGGAALVAVFGLNQTSTGVRLAGSWNRSPVASQPGPGGSLAMVR